MKALYLSKVSPVFTNTRIFFPSDDTLRTGRKIKECIASISSLATSARVRPDRSVCLKSVIYSEWPDPLGTKSEHLSVQHGSLLTVPPYNIAQIKCKIYAVGETNVLMPDAAPDFLLL